MKGEHNNIIERHAISNLKRHLKLFTSLFHTGRKTARAQQFQTRNFLKFQNNMLKQNYLRFMRKFIFFKFVFDPRNKL